MRYVRFIPIVILYVVLVTGGVFLWPEVYGFFVISGECDRDLTPEGKQLMFVLCVIGIALQILLGRWLFAESGIDTLLLFLGYVGLSALQIYVFNIGSRKKKDDYALGMHS